MTRPVEKPEQRTEHQETDRHGQAGEKADFFLMRRMLWLGPARRAGWENHPLTMHRYAATAIRCSPPDSSLECADNGGHRVTIRRELTNRELA